MNSKLANFKLSGLLSYLITRTKLRFVDKASIIAGSKIAVILGQTVTLDLMDLEQKYLAADCVREPENLIVYRAIADSGLVDTFIDIGANCGHVAASIMNDYKHVLLFEPNPKLAALLQGIFKKQENIEIHECAIVDQASTGSLTLTVPDESSGLATLGSTDLSKQYNQVHTYNVRASTLASEVNGLSIRNAYIKIDVEGFEANIIESARELINSQRPIVGFEALSNEAALSCARLFDDYNFYCARFDFLENGGALSRSVLGMIKALIFGGNIEVLKLHHLEKTNLDNFSQIYSVPREKVEDFEKSILTYSTKNPVFDLKSLKIWS
ncbi:Methyltransferase FkbM [Methylophilaceae bacterium]